MSYAQTGIQKNLTVNYDVAQFRNTSELGYLEICFGFSPHQLAFHKVGTMFRGGVNFTVQLKKNDSENTIYNRRYYCPVQLADTSDVTLAQMFVSQRGYELPFGPYLLEVVAVDSFNSSNSSRVLINNINIVKFADVPRSSDLELCSSIASSKDTTQLFYKNSFNVIPNPSLVFGGSDYPVIFHYLELYNLDKDSIYMIETIVKDQKGEAIKHTARQKRFGVRNAVEVGTTNITSLQSGKYQYQVSVLDGSKSEIMISKKTFFINNPLAKPVISPISAKTTEFLGMSDDELESEFRVAKYLANEQDIKTFSALSNAAGRREFLADFWANIENGRRGRIDLTRFIYLEHVKIANQRYSAMGREGWLSDRGRVYLLYAEPSEVQRYPSSDETKPYEIWSYDQIEGGIIFVFVDRTGFGEYILIHSTKRGEIQDVNWERKLKETIQ